MAKQTNETPEAPEKSEEPADRPLLDASQAPVKKMLARAKERGYVTYDELNAVLPSEEYTSEKIEDIMKEMSRSASLKFSALFAGATSRTEVVVTFLAMLELIRLRQIVATQNTPFGEIELVRAPQEFAPEAVNPAGAYAEAVAHEALTSPAPASHPASN